MHFQKIPLALSASSIRIMASKLIYLFQNNKNQNQNLEGFIESASNYSIQTARQQQLLQLQSTLKKFFIVENCSADTRILKAYLFIKVKFLFELLKLKKQLERDSFELQQVKLNQIQRLLPQGKIFKLKIDSQIKKNKLEEIQFISTFYGFFQFYFQWKKRSKIVHFHKGYLEQWSNLMSHCNNQMMEIMTNDNLKELLQCFYQVQSLQQTQYMNQHGDIGNRLQNRIKEIFERFKKYQSIIYLGEKIDSFSIDALQIQNDILNLEQTIEKFKEKVEKSRKSIYTQVAILSNTERAKYILKLTAIMNKNRKYKITVSFIEVGKNGPEKQIVGVYKQKSAN